MEKNSVLGYLLTAGVASVVTFVATKKFLDVARTRGDDDEEALAGWLAPLGLIVVHRRRGVLAARVGLAVAVPCVPVAGGVGGS